MELEKLLKSISDILKKNNDFFVNNSELFKAVEERFYKAFDDDEEDGQNMWDAMTGEGSHGDGEEDQYDENPYDLWDSADSDHSEEDQSDEDYETQGEKTFQDIDDYGESSDEDKAQEEALKRLQTKKETKPQDVKSLKQEVKPETKTPSSRSEWKPKDKYAPHHQKAMDDFMGQGYSHREAERLANAHDMLDFYSASRNSIKPSEPSPKFLSDMKDIASDYMRNYKQVTGINADPKHNPVLHANAVANKQHADNYSKFDKDFNSFLSDLGEVGGAAKHKAIKEWKKKWHEDNPEHISNIVNAANKSSSTADSNIAQRKEHLEDQAKQLTEAHMAPTETTGTVGQYSSMAAGVPEGSMSSDMASQMAGGQRDADDESGKMSGISTRQDPSVGFAEKNKPYVDKLRQKLTPEQNQRLSSITGLKTPKGNE
jgi:hypothetical protein